MSVREALRGGQLSKSHLMWIVFWSALAIVGTIAAPLLLTNPLLLMALSPRAVFVALAARDSHLIAFVVIGLVRLSVTDPSYFMVGRQIGRGGFLPRLLPWLRSDRDEGTGRLEGSRRFARQMCRSRPLAAVVLFLRPNARHVALAASQGIPALLIALATTTGTVTYLFAMRVGMSAF